MLPERAARWMTRPRRPPGAQRRHGTRAASGAELRCRSRRRAASALMPEGGLPSGLRHQAGPGHRVMPREEPEAPAPGL